MTVNAISNVRFDVASAKFCMQFSEGDGSGDEGGDGGGDGGGEGGGDEGGDEGGNEGGVEGGNEGGDEGDDDSFRENHFPRKKMRRRYGYFCSVLLTYGQQSFITTAKEHFTFMQRNI